MYDLKIVGAILKKAYTKEFSLEHFYSHDQYFRQHQDKTVFDAPRQLLFSHEFAKRFWGFEDMEFRVVLEKITYPAWLYHLKAMVEVPDPLTYMKQFLTEEEIKKGLNKNNDI